MLVGLAVLALDVATKWLVMTRMVEFEQISLIPGFFSLQFVRNPGAAFGILAHQQWLFISVSLGAIVGMLYAMRRPEFRVGLVPWAMGFLMGGAAGNLVDRLRFGKVVDFFLFTYHNWSFPNFNVADIGITTGVGLFILHLMRTEERGGHENL